MKKRILLLCVVIMCIVAACTGPTHPVVKTTPTPTTEAPTPTPSAFTPTPSGNPSVYPWGMRTKTSSCLLVMQKRPDPDCTPGAVFAHATPALICTSGYAGSVRNVPESEKSQAYAAYGITKHAPGQYEVDHLVPLELGGSNDIANLWPEAASPRLGFHEKDILENALHSAVCAGKLPLQVAQAQIVHNWQTAYMIWVTMQGAGKG